MNGAAAMAMPAQPAPRESWLFGWIATVDHKRIGILYLFTSVVFFVIGGIQALLIRLQLWSPNSHFLSPDAYNQMFTMHGTTMIFLVVMPTLIGLANYFVPLMIGARDMAFPRLNAMSYWMLPCGGLLLYFSYWTGGAPAVGWFAYAPLSESAFSSSPGVDYWIISLLILGTGSIAASINLIATVLCMRAPGMSMRKLPLFVWMNFINSFLIIFALPALNAAIIMLLIDRTLSANFFLPFHGGSALLWQHFFWSFGHPEVYIMALPAFGMISEMIPVFSRKPIFGYPFVAASTVAIALLSFGVWAHHMFTSGLGHTVDLFFAAASMLIAVPTGVKIFNWSATMWGGAVRLTTPMLFAIAFLIQFTIGGLSGITFATVPIDWATTDTYYVVAHFHYVLFGGSLFGVLGAVYYWFPKMSGRMLSERLGKLQFWTMLIGFNLTFFVQHYLGLMGMPRRVYTYPDFPAWAVLNRLSTVGAFVMAFSVAVLLWNILASMRGGKLAGDNPWQAWTLEWATTSPPPAENFTALPAIRSRRPLWDLAHPESPDQPLDTAHPEKIPEKNQVSMLTFIASEGFFFLMLITAFIYYNFQFHSGPNAGSALNPALTSVYTVLLLGSSLTFWFSERYLHRGNHHRFRLWLGLTILLGLVFIIGQGREYAHLLREGVTMNRNLFATTFFTLTGFHGLHVCVGLIGLAVLLGLGLKGQFQTGRIEAVRSLGLYWHFVDAVWIFVFTTVYLVGPHL